MQRATIGEGETNGRRATVVELVLNGSSTSNLEINWNDGSFDARARSRSDERADVSADNRQTHDRLSASQAAPVMALGIFQTVYRCSINGVFDLSNERPVVHPARFERATP